MDKSRAGTEEKAKHLEPMSLTQYYRLKRLRTLSGYPPMVPHIVDCCRTINPHCNDKVHHATRRHATPHAKMTTGLQHDTNQEIGMHKHSRKDLSAEKKPMRTNKAPTATDTGSQSTRNKTGSKQLWQQNCSPQREQPYDAQEVTNLDSLTTTSSEVTDARR